MTDEATKPELTLNPETLTLTSVPSAEMLQKLAEFDALSFEGDGKTTSDEFGPPAMSAEEIKQSIEKSMVYLVRTNILGEIVAVASYVIRRADKYGTDVHISSIAVDPRLRGKKIADNLLTQIYEVARNQRIDKVTLRVDPLNAQALGFYLKRGFLVVGARSRNLGEGYENIVTLAATKILETSATFEDEGSEIVVDLENFEVIDQYAKQGLVGVEVREGKLVMKKLSGSSRAKFTPWS